MINVRPRNEDMHDMKYTLFQRLLDTTGAVAIAGTMGSVSRPARAAENDDLLCWRQVRRSPLRFALVALPLCPRYDLFRRVFTHLVFLCYLQRRSEVRSVRVRLDRLHQAD
jgi:hypothetical protein